MTSSVRGQEEVLKTSMASWLPRRRRVSASARESRSRDCDVGGDARSTA